MRILSMLAIVAMMTGTARADMIDVPIVAANPLTGNVMDIRPPLQGAYRHDGNFYYRGVPGTSPRNQADLSGFGYPPHAFSNGIRAPRAQVHFPPADGATRMKHINWCDARYRSYRMADNTFQPYEGERKRCVSPYS